MPNRILRDWTDSHAVNVLSAEEERFFTRLLMKADDFGRFHGQDRLLNASLFPLHKFDDAQVGEWCDACEKAEILKRYKDAKNREYIEILNFKQRTRQQISKFPNPNDRHMTVTRPSIDGQLTVTRPSIDRLDGDGDGDGDGGGDGGGKTDQPTDLPPSLEICLGRFTQWPTDKVEEVWQSFEHAKVDGRWMWGKNPVNDPFEAFAIRLKDRTPDPIPTDINASLQSLAKTINVPMPKASAPREQSKPNGRVFISELKEKRRVLGDRLKEIQFRGHEDAHGIHYANNEDKAAAREVRKRIREIDDEILMT